MKKLLLTLGAVTAVATPAITITSCGTKKVSETKSEIPLRTQKSELQTHQSMMGIDDIKDISRKLFNLRLKHKLTLDKEEGKHAFKFVTDITDRVPEILEWERANSIVASDTLGSAIIEESRTKSLLIIVQTDDVSEQRTKSSWDISSTPVPYVLNEGTDEERTIQIQGIPIGLAKSLIWREMVTKDKNFLEKNPDLLTKQDDGEAFVFRFAEFYNRIVQPLIDSGTHIKKEITEFSDYLGEYVGEALVEIPTYSSSSTFIQDEYTKYRNAVDAAYELKNMDIYKKIVDVSEEKLLLQNFGKDMDDHFSKALKNDLTKLDEILTLIEGSSEPDILTGIIVSTQDVWNSRINDLTHSLRNIIALFAVAVDWAEKPDQLVSIGGEESNITKTVAYLSELFDTLDITK